MSNKKLLKKWTSIVAQIVLWILIFLAIHSWQTRDMLEQKAPQPILLTDLEGTLHSVEFKGNTLIYFFAPWCQVCHFSIETVDQVARDYPHIQFLIIALDWQHRQQVASFIREHQLQTPVLLGDSHISELFKIRGYPSYYVIDDQGQIIHKDIGLTTKLGLVARLRLLTDISD